MTAFPTSMTDSFYTAYLRQRRRRQVVLRITFVVAFAAIVMALFLIGRTSFWIWSNQP